VLKKHDPSARRRRRDAVYDDEEEVEGLMLEDAVYGGIDADL